MAESTLAVSWDELRRRVAKKRGYDPDTSNWTPEQIVDVDDIIRSGYRLFIQPRPLNGPPHEWSFMKPLFQLILPDGQEDVDLPAEFGFLIGDLYFLDNTSALMQPLKRRNDGKIQMLRQQADQTSGRPEFCAIVPNTRPTVSKGQRFQLMLWPTPDQDYTVQGRCSVHPEALGLSHPYPWGGAAHGETLIQACLAASEQFNDTPGPSVAHFAECLAASIEYDRRVGAQVMDNMDGRRTDRWGRFLHGWPFNPAQGTITTYNGLYN